jgi:hypothetical protein
VLIFGWWWVGIMGQDNAGRRQLTLLLSNKDKLDDDFVRDLMRGLSTVRSSDFRGDGVAYEGREWMEAVLVAIAAGLMLDELLLVERALSVNLLGRRADGASAMRRSELVQVSACAHASCKAWVWAYRMGGERRGLDVLLGTLGVCAASN